MVSYVASTAMVEQVVVSARRVFVHLRGADAEKRSVAARRVGDAGMVPLWKENDNEIKQVTD